MNPATLQLIIAMLPVAERLVIEGGKIVATLRADLTADEMIAALEASKSANWPKLDFASAQAQVTAP